MNSARRFVGKDSPVHFFWGSFDLAVTRFSGRRAPERPGADSITREAYSHEVSSVGFWPGSGTMSGPAFYSYAAPEPAGIQGSAGASGRSSRTMPRLGSFCSTTTLCELRPIAERGAARFLPKHLRCRGEPGQMGSAVAGTRWGRNWINRSKRQKGLRWASFRIHVARLVLSPISQKREMDGARR